MAAVMPDVLGKHVKIESFVCKTVYLAIFFYNLLQAYVSVTLKNIVF